MKRDDIVKLAAGQLEASRKYRRQAIVAAMEGHTQKAAAFFSYSRHYLIAARSFMRDAHTENYDRLRLRGKHAGVNKEPTS